eukprot:3595987-Amphidinium_carterae.1
MHTNSDTHNKNYSHLALFCAESWLASCPAQECGASENQRTPMRSKSSLANTLVRYHALLILPQQIANRDIASSDHWFDKLRITEVRASELSTKKFAVCRPQWIGLMLFSISHSMWRTQWYVHRVSKAICRVRTGMVKTQVMTHFRSSASKNFKY